MSQRTSLLAAGLVHARRRHQADSHQGRGKQDLCGERCGGGGILLAPPPLPLVSSCTRFGEPAVALGAFPQRVAPLYLSPPPPLFPPQLPTTILPTWLPPAATRPPSLFLSPPSPPSPQLPPLDLLAPPFPPPEQLPTAYGNPNSFVRLATTGGTFFINYRRNEAVYEQVPN